MSPAVAGRAESDSFRRQRPRTADFVSLVGDMAAEALRLDSVGVDACGSVEVGRVGVVVGGGVVG